MKRIQIHTLNDRKDVSGCVSPPSALHDLHVHFRASEKEIDEDQPAFKYLTHENLQGSLKWLNTMKDLTKALGLCRSNIHSKMRQGLFPSGIKIGASRRWPAPDIIAWLEQQRNLGIQA